MSQVVASFENARMGQGLLVSADVSADTMGSAWVNLHIINNRGEIAREVLAIDTAEHSSMFAAINAAKRVVLDDNMKPTGSVYSLADIVRRVYDKKTTAEVASGIANKLTNEVNAAIVEAVMSNNDSFLVSCVKQGALRGAFARLAA